MDFTLSDEDTLIRSTVSDFVQREVMPYESVLLRREVEGSQSASPGLTRQERRDLQNRGRAAGLWGIDTPTLYARNDQQRQEYLIPTIEGNRQPCIAISEPGGGSDVRAMRMTARRRADVGTRSVHCTSGLPRRVARRRRP